MTNTLNDKFAHFTRNGERAIEEGRKTQEEVNKWYSETIVKPSLLQDLSFEHLNLEKQNKTSVTSYIGTSRDKCYILTPIKGNSTNEIAYKLGCYLMGAIESGMQIGKAGCMKLSGALKQTGTTLDVDNDAKIKECQSKPKVKMIENKGYMVVEIESNQNYQDVKDYFFKKFNNEECQPKALKEKGIKHKMEKIDSKELTIFLSK